MPHEDTLFTFSTSAGTIVTTEDHQYWNDTDQQWQDTQDLDTGDELLSADGSVVTVEGLQWRTVRWGEAWDLTVDDLHTFYVLIGGEEVLVHNANPICFPAWNKLTLDLDHIVSGHTTTGIRNTVGKKDVFENMSDAQISSAIKEAYGNATKLATQAQGDEVRILVEGAGGGYTIQMWVNTTTNTIETAYPTGLS